MPKRRDIRTILIIGSGPIVIGQACEFDYSGTQGCKALREEGYRVVLVNSNPATIMTDPEFGDRTYIEPITPEVVTSIIEKERPEALLPTLGGQTALNIVVALAESGVLDRCRVELIGAKLPAIKKAEDRDLFKQAMTRIGLEVPESGYAGSMEAAQQIIQRVGYPAIIRPSFTLGGTGGNIAYNREEFEEFIQWGLNLSPVRQVLIEASVIGWKEYELEVMRDLKDNVVIICSIENFDPMGIHTGDSITVAPAQTLTDKEYQMMRDAAIAIIREIGVETGGSNIQFAVDPATGRMVVIEMNPRVSRSSALASKATGFPIAKIAAKLAVGYTLDEIPNDITRKTPASFEPVIDYVVTKIPRWAFEKLPGTAAKLGTQMQSVGEAMAIGRTFAESLQKALRSLEHGRAGLNCDPGEAAFDAVATDELLRLAAVATPERIYEVESLLRRGVTVDEVHEATRIDAWFLDQMLAITEERAHLATKGTGEAALEAMTEREWRRAKRMGFGDAQLGYLWQLDELAVRAARLATGVEVTYKTVDTCAAEFEAETPYHYGTYEDTTEVAPSNREKVIILGSGPNRIGQGIEFDYCCVHACFALAAAGYETIMVNCNPETVSTDYDTSDRLYFEPLSVEGVLNVIEAERLSAKSGGGRLKGVIVSLGGQTPLKLADTLPPELVLGTSAASIDAAEDRDLWGSLCARLEIPQPAGGTATTIDEALGIVERIGFPALVRPSYVLGGRAMEIVYDADDLTRAWAAIGGAGSLGREGGLSAQRPVLVDRFLEDATEVDVDAIRDHTGEVIIGGIMEHVEEAGVHSGDSACVIPPVGLSAATIAVIEDYTRRIAEALDVRGLINVQFAVKRVVGPEVEGGGQVFVIEANPRASRTVPFVAKATGVPLVKVASRVMCGSTLAELREEMLLVPPSTGEHIAVKEAVLPWSRFPEVDALLGPEMRSTGEVMGIDATVGMAFAKSQLAAGDVMPTSGTVFFSLADRDKAMGLQAARRFAELGFELVATSGTAAHLRDNGLEVGQVVAKVRSVDPDAAAPDAGAPTDPDHVDGVDLISSGRVQLVVNSPRGRGPRADGAHLRRAAAAHKVPLLTTAAAALAAANGIGDWTSRDFSVTSLQDHHRPGGRP